jgi:hypothetical protein
MPKIEVVKVEWVNENEAHIYPPDGGLAWWARPVANMRRRDRSESEVLWELNDSDGETEGYYESPEDAFDAVSEKYDDAPVVVTKERDS